MIETKLEKLAKSNIYPFHMPGHKRRIMEMANPYQLDITEIEGFDNLHGAEGLLKEAQDNCAALYEADRSFFLINGSTCGLLAAISAGAPKKSKVIVARNCHKAVYHGIFLRELSPVYVYPEITSEGIQGQIKAETLEKVLKANPDAAAVVITCPTYDGIVSDISEIAGLVHGYDIPLIVDQAHGAHFGMERRLPQNAGRLGADAVIVSLHKTLPAFTQTAALNLYGDRISADTVEKYLDIYETSSPSYVLMAGIDKCIRYLQSNGQEIFPRYMDMVEAFYARVKDLKYLKVKAKAEDFDCTKLLIFTGGSSIDGPKLSELLLEKYGLELEMTASSYVLALSSVMDTEEGFNRLAEALLEIDKGLEISERDRQIASGDLYQELEKALEIHQVEDILEGTADFSRVGLEAATGKISADYLYLYPPGIPILVPGEVISAELVAKLKDVENQGLRLHGLDDEGMIKIVNPS